MTLLPKVSFLIPTLNAAGILETCLRSIHQQDYPRDLVEIVVADGGSTDGTRELAARYQARVVENPRRGYDSGKCEAFAASTGTYVVFVDADNEISHPDFTRRAVEALMQHPRALGLESYYPASPRMTSLCVYLSELLHISDPVAWMMSVNPVRVGAEAGVERWTFPEGSLAFPMGANGFVFKRSDLAHLQAKDLFEDCTVVLELAQAGRKEWLRIPGRGVHHYVVNGFRDFVRKRRRQTFHFLAQRREGRVSWTQFRPMVPGWMACVYCITVIGPVFHTVRGLWRTGHPAWLWHLVTCPASVFGIAWGVLTYRMRGKDPSAEANLQPRQVLNGGRTESGKPTDRPIGMSPAGRKLYLYANAVWGDLVGGGDIHFFELARGAAAAGFEVYCFGGPALQKHVTQAGLPVRVILTEHRRRAALNEGSLGGQLRMFLDYIERCVNAIRLGRRVGKDDIVYAVTDYWCDSIPMLLSRARRKTMVFHMEAPTLREIVLKSRPDVEAGRLASLHYWLSQNLSLRLFRLCRNKHLFILHPAMRARMLDMGYGAHELSQISYGVDTATAESVPAQERAYDVCWIGRVHRQKGIDDLLATFKHLAGRIPKFRALLMGKVETGLRPRIEELGLQSVVHFSGFVSEPEKFRLFKASRLFLMPSRHEGSPRVVGEAVVCGVPVLAYDLPTYAPVFGDYARYVRAFDLKEFCAEAERLVLSSRAGVSYLDNLDLVRFRQANSWEATRSAFLETLSTRL